MDSLMNVLGFYRVETKGNGMNINAALGMTSERPLKGPSREWLLKMAEAEDQCQSVSVPYVEREHIHSKGCWCNPVIEDYSQQSDECSTCGIGSRLPSGVCDHCNQPVVDPPRERDDVAELRRAIDDWRKLDELNNRIKDELREQLEQVTRERDRLEQMHLTAIQFRAETATELQQAREQLATAQAEAAAMRRLLARWQSEIDTCSCTLVERQQFRDSVRQVMRSTAGRELLDEVQRKDERIRELEADNGELYRYNDAAKRQEKTLLRKCRTAKLAYVETLRGKIDPAWFGDCEYRRRDDGCCYRRNGSEAQLWVANCRWDSSIEYRSWDQLIASGETYPCDEHGKRIEESMSIKQVEHVECNCGGTITHMAVVIGDQVIRIADLERQLAEHERDAELCRELRALLQGTSSISRFGLDRVVIYVGLKDGVAIHESLISIRDGGAK